MDPVLSLGTLILIAAVCAALAVALLGVVFAGNRSVEKDVRRRLGSKAPVVAQPGWRGLPLVRRFTSRAEVLAERRGLLHSLNMMLERSNLPLSAGEAILATVSLAVVVGAIAGAVLGSLWWGLAVGGATLLVSYVYVQNRATREKGKFEDQLPDTLNLLSTSLKAGYSLLQAVEAVARDAPDPTGREFGRAVSEIRLGTSVTEAISGAADRMSSVDFGWAVMAIDIQRDVGGNLAEVLTIASDTLIARNRLRRETKALTAEGRISAVVLTMVPLGIAAFLWISNPDYLDPLINTTPGRIAIVSSIVAYLIGVVWIRRIVDIDV